MPRDTFPQLLQPESTLPLTSADVEQIWTLAYREHRLTSYNVARVPGRKTDKGYALHETATAILIEDAPRAGVTSEDSAITLSDGRTAYAHLEFDGKAVTGLREAEARAMPGVEIHIIPMGDHAWAVYPGKDKPAHMVDKRADAITAHDHFGGQHNTSLEGIKPFAVEGRVYGSNLAITKVQSFEDPALSISIAKAKEAEQAYQQRLSIVTRHMTPELMLRLIKISPVGSAIPDHADPQRSVWDDEMRQATYGMLRDFKKAGLLAACPNNGPRKVHELHGWDSWVGSDVDVPNITDLPFEMHALQWTPVFTKVLKAYFHASYDLYPDRDAGKKDLPYSLESREYDRKASLQMAREMAHVIATDRIDLGDSISLYSKLGVERLGIEGSMLRPVLTQYDEHYRNPKVLEPIEAPKPLRHIVLPVPSGRLFAADWARINGFNEIEEKLIGNHEIGTSRGLIGEQQELYEKMGALKIQVGNTNPTAYQVSDGVWRAGRRDEDQFWNEDTDELEIPHDESWKTCTDLWANLYIDFDQLTSVLMASGEYASDDDARQAIEAYAAETYGANIIDMNASKLNFYVPNGGSYLSEEVMAELAPHLASHGFKEGEDWSDHYFLSEAELPVPEKFLEHHDWVHAGPMASEEPAAEPGY